MKFGILASHQYPQSENLRESLRDLFSLVEYAAELQYDSVFAIHHYVANLQTPQVISMTGGTGGKLREISDVNLNVELGKNSSRIQETHIFIVHSLVDLMDRFFLKE
jgi:hypothetical protein